jgi:hypothetical protein
MKEHWTFIQGNWYHGKSVKTAGDAKASEKGKDE